MSATPPPISGAPIELSCPRCGAAQRLPASTAGTRQTCSACQQSFKVPAAASTAKCIPSPPAAPAPAQRPTPSAPPAAPRPAAPTPVQAATSAGVVELTSDDEAHLPFDSLDSLDAPATSPKAPAYFAPPTPPPASPRPSAAGPAETPVDKDAFYEEPPPTSNRPIPKSPSRAPVYIDNRHRVFNEEGLILVVCGICGTRTYFGAEKAKTQQQCPDCFTKFSLPELPPGPEKPKPTRPPEDLDELKLEETFERRGYQPMHRDSVAADLVRGAAPLQPGAIPVAGIPVAGVPTATAPPPGGVIAPPLPPPMVTASTAPGGAASLGFATPSTPPVDAAPSMVDPSSRLARPPNWAVLVGVFDFAFRPLNLICMIGFTLGLMVPIFFAIAAWKSGNMVLLVITAGLATPLMVAPLLFLFSFMVHVVHDSSYGEDETKNWSGANVVDNFIASIYVLCAIFFAGLPGFLLSLPLIPAFGENAQFLLIVLSGVMLFPFCLLSLMEEESYWQCYSHEVALSFRRSKDQVFLFVCTTFIFTVLCLVGIFGIGSIAGEESGVTTYTIVMAVIVLVCVYWIISYSRMVGRLAWVMNYEAQFGPMDDD